MTRKDYIAIAAALKSANSCAANMYISPEALTAIETHSNLAARAIAHAMALDNPQFDRSRFLTACGVTHA